MADPVWLADELRKAGLNVEVLSGALERGHGDFGEIWGIIDHHTGGNPPSNNPWAIANHPQLGLASQIHLARDGKVTICGVGIAYHAGVGSWPGIQKNNANQVTIGVEAENNGTEGWTKAQYEAYTTLNAVILKKIGKDSSHTIGHKEWAAIQGKWDPGGMDMNKFRRDVQAKIDNGVGTPSVPAVNEINECAKRYSWVGKRVKPVEPTTEMQIGKDGKGRLVEFENGLIYFHPTTGAHAIPRGGLYESYATYGWESGALGYPVREFTRLKSEDGTTFIGGVQAFQRGVLYRKENAAEGFYITGKIGERWAKEGFERGPLGWPTSLEYKDKFGNTVQDFDHGKLYWSADGVVRG